MKLFESYSLGAINLKNRIVMAPMTRSRATQDHIPTPIMATYYAQRSGAGLIITEGTAPSPNGVGYARIPGIYNTAQAGAWSKVTQAVHDHGGRIFIQLMHTGRVSHPLNMPPDAKIMAPSAITLKETKMYTDEDGEQPMPQPSEMTSEEIQNAIQEYVESARHAVEAGFDGVELHGANGYLIEQFIAPSTNTRTDAYGGSVENRCRFTVEVAQKVVDAIGGDKVGIRISPYGVFNEIMPYPETHETYVHLASKLKETGIVYMHIVDHASMGTPEVPKAVKEAIRDTFGGTIIVSGGYDKDHAERDLSAGLGHLVAFGRPFIANPDLPEKLKNGTPLTEPDYATFYTPGEKGYTDY